jgi:hypothetical protein
MTAETVARHPDCPQTHLPHITDCPYCRELYAKSSKEQAYRDALTKIRHLLRSNPPKRDFDLAMSAINGAYDIANKALFAGGDPFASPHETNDARDACRYRYLREHALLSNGPSLRWHLRHRYRENLSPMERLDADIDEALPAVKANGNQASSVPSDTDANPPSPRGSLPNSLGTSEKTSSPQCPPFDRELNDQIEAVARVIQEELSAEGRTPGLANCAAMAGRIINAVRGPSPRNGE